MCMVVNTRVFWFLLRSDFIFKLTKYYKIQENALKILHSTTENLIKQRRKEFALKKQMGETEDDTNEFCK